MNSSTSDSGKRSHEGSCLEKGSDDKRRKTMDTEAARGAENEDEVIKQLKLTIKKQQLTIKEQAITIKKQEMTIQNKEMTIKKQEKELEEQRQYRKGLYGQLTKNESDLEELKDGRDNANKRAEEYKKRMTEAKEQAEEAKTREEKASGRVEEVERENMALRLQIEEAEGRATEAEKTNASVVETKNECLSLKHKVGLLEQKLSVVHELAGSYLSATEAIGDQNREELEGTVISNDKEVDSSGYKLTTEQSKDEEKEVIEEGCLNQSEQNGAPAAESASGPKDKLYFNTNQRSKIDEERWDNMFAQLVRYKNTNDGQVPTAADINGPYQHLYLWMAEQKRRYKATAIVPGGRERNGARALHEDEYIALEQSGFISSPREERWERNFKNLQRFKEKYRHLNISEAEFPSLYRWLKHQRIKFCIRHDKNFPNTFGGVPLSHRHEEKLRSIGVEFLQPSV